MYNLNKAYSKKFFVRRKSLAWRVPIVCDAIIDVLKPKSVIDIGCGNGDLVKGFVDRQIIVWGIEGTNNCKWDEFTRSWIFIHDLRKPIPNEFLIAWQQLDKRNKLKFDLAICFEVAEHIEPEYTDIFLDNLCSVSNKILFSAAGPGQGGIHHHNCQSNEYWKQKFCLREYKYKSFPVELLTFYWYKWRNKKGIKAYFQNLMYFERGLR